MMTTQQHVASSPDALTNVELELKSRSRRLRLDLSAGGYLYVSVTRPRTHASLAFLCGPRLSECRLDDDRGRYTLWCGDAAFPVSMKEAAAIRRVYAPLGLRLTPEVQA